MGWRNLEVRMSTSMEDNLEAIFQFLQSKEFGFFSCLYECSEMSFAKYTQTEPVAKAIFQE